MSESCHIEGLVSFLPHPLEDKVQNSILQIKKLDAGQCNEPLEVTRKAEGACGPGPVPGAPSHQCVWEAGRVWGPRRGWGGADVLQQLSASSQSPFGRGTGLCQGRREEKMSGKEELMNCRPRHKLDIIDVPPTERDGSATSPSTSRGKQPRRAGPPSPTFHASLPGAAHPRLSTALFPAE